mmetsp:Transcript_17057/g.27704  ORF Transcript_17057/g.27704 Transcript_17057/m.27704 type:complete len:81 (-) Transcript_17057:66-308(-)
MLRRAKQKSEIYAANEPSSGHLCCKEPSWKCCCKEPGRKICYTEPRRGENICCRELGRNMSRFNVEKKNDQRKNNLSRES